MAKGGIEPDETHTDTSHPIKPPAGVMARLWSELEWDAQPDRGEQELIDGVARGRAAPSPAHELVKARLAAILTRLVPHRYAVATDAEVRLAEVHRRRPDVLVAFEEALQVKAWYIESEEVILAVEIVSPGTETTDRKHKPIEYSDADIGHYWRVETEPEVSVHCYCLGERTQYLETGIFRAGDLVYDPTLRWASFEVDDLLPQ